MTVTHVVGSGPLADGLRVGLGGLGHTLASTGTAESALDACVVVGPAARPDASIDSWDDETFGALWEDPLRGTVTALIDARRRGAKRLVVVTSTAGMTGAEHNAPAAMTAEALRALVKSAARQWGADGITVNSVVADPSWFGGSPDAVSIAAPSLGGPGDAAADLAPVVAFCCSDAAHHLTGATLTVDGGAWMP